MSWFRPMLETRFETDARRSHARNPSTNPKSENPIRVVFLPMSAFDGRTVFGI